MSDRDSGPNLATPALQWIASDGAIMTPPGARTPLLVVFSGPSGVGKTTVTNELVRQGWDGHIVVTATTRRPRPGEVNGKDYHFHTQHEFQDMLERGDLLEHAEVHGNWYGVPAQPVRETLAQGTDVLLTIDTQGARTIRARTQGAVFIFLAPRSLDELVERLNVRGTDTPEQRTLRILNAEREMAELDKYDYVIVNQNDRLSETIEQLRAILCAEHCRVHPHRPVV